MNKNQQTPLGIFDFRSKNSRPQNLYCLLLEATLQLYSVRAQFLSRPCIRSQNLESGHMRTNNLIYLIHRKSSHICSGYILRLWKLKPRMRGIYTTIGNRKLGHVRSRHDMFKVLEIKPHLFCCRDIHILRGTHTHTGADQRLSLGAARARLGDDGPKISSSSAKISSSESSSRCTLPATLQ